MVRLESFNRDLVAGRQAAAIRRRGIAWPSQAIRR
jgi:hypothetical protein